MQRLVSPHWIVVRTLARRERWAQQNIENQGADTYCPRFRNDADDERGTPLFRGYVFVLVHRHWWFLKNTFGVVHVLMHDDKPERVRNSIIVGLRKQEDGDGLISLPEEVKPNGPRWHQLLHILGGPMQGRVGQYEGVMSGERFRVLLQFLGQARAVGVPRHQCQLVA